MNDNKASLGCGTLILIALIVLIFGNSGREEVLTEVRALQRQTADLASDVDGLRQELREVKLLLEER